MKKKSMDAQIADRLNELGVGHSEDPLITGWLNDPKGILLVFTNSPRTCYGFASTCNAYAAQDMFRILLKTHFAA